ncbi:hypothetical protein RchiOBHm_Chr5g0024231 [Rosa chinensis]|uniref:Uncharacterized protein n=1 Tax=Rosa chinensis TaxID=74649 RepID=A0A2P6Q899_ROSCH|nr:hypothetical protein RchiOBHm_Chr5g0024231 [Rosa chinensis]
MVHSKPCALLYSSLFLLLLVSSEIAFARLSASSKSKDLDLLMNFGSDKVTRPFAGKFKLFGSSKVYEPEARVLTGSSDFHPLVRVSVGGGYGHTPGINHGRQ